MFKQAIKKAYYAGASIIGADALVLNKLKREGKAAVLNLHRVSPNASAYWPPLHPQVFEELLRFLQSNFEVCRIAELDEIKSSKPVAVLSFDDGYYDFIEFALPLLEKYKLPANMNIIPQCAVSGKPIWNVQIYDFLQAAPRKFINDMTIPGFDAKLENESPGAKVRFGLQVSRYL